MASVERVDSAARAVTVLVSGAKRLPAISRPRLGGARRGPRHGTQPADGESAARDSGGDDEDWCPNTTRLRFLFCPRPSPN